jgi:hypothetical protein
LWRVAPIVTVGDRYWSMAGNQDGDTPVRQDVSQHGGAYVGRRDLYVHPVQVLIYGSQGVQAGERNTHVNNYFIGENADLRQTGGSMGSTPTGRPLGEVTDSFALEVVWPVQVRGRRPKLPTLPAVRAPRAR